MSFYFSKSEWDHYSELYFAGANTQEMLEYFEKVAAFCTDTNLKVTAHLRVACLLFDRGDTSAAKVGYLLVIEYRDNCAVDRKVIGNACNNLAYMYRYGIGVDAWRERAVELYRMGIQYADNQRCKNALREMGEIY